MRQIVDYKLIIEDTRISAEREVGVHILNGWQPLGPVSVCVNMYEGNDYGCISQAMVKYEGWDEASF